MLSSFVLSTILEWLSFKRKQLKWQRVAFDRIRELPVGRHARLGQGKGPEVYCLGQGRGSGKFTAWYGVGRGGVPGVYCLVEGEGSESLLLGTGDWGSGSLLLVQGEVSGSLLLGTGWDDRSLLLGTGWGFRKFTVWYRGLQEFTAWYRVGVQRVYCTLSLSDSRNPAVVPVAWISTQPSTRSIWAI